MHRWKVLVLPLNLPVPRLNMPVLLLNLPVPRFNYSPTMIGCS